MIKYINIFGSTGTIGTKSLKIINSYFPNIKINLLTANHNYKKLAKQALFYKSKYIYLSDQSKYKKIKKEIDNDKINILDDNELFDYLKKNSSDLTILSISGYESLKYIQSIIINTKNLGVVNKECIVSAGNIINKLSKKHKTKIFALDSEHFSIENYLNKNLNFKKNNLKKLFITASGGPFLNRSNDYIKFATFKEAIKHPKWNMGNKNSIDSATLVNKCLEIIEAHYLFNIEYKKLKIIIHPESLVHSIFEFDDLTSSLNYFYHDMFIPLFNFLNITNSKKVVNFSNRNYKFNLNSKLSFFKPSKNKFPILKLFEKMNKNQHHNIINFNAGNELAVDLFSKDKIKFGDINKIIEKSLSLDLKIELNNIENIIMYQNELIKKLNSILLGKY